MMNKTNVALIGDYNSTVTAHRAIPVALQIAAREQSLKIESTWIETISLNENVDETLSGCDGVWCVPASPYANMEGVLRAIQYCRVNRLPFLGTCGGYQHAVLEFARNVLGLTHADNAEVNPSTQFPLISPLICALVEQDDQIQLLQNTKIQQIYQQITIKEKYRCSYGVNANYLSLFDDSDLIFSGYDLKKDPRSLEIKDHPFFIATAYQPERLALSGKNHPLINHFVKHCQNN